jgi:2-phosphoglycerate kinase
MIYLIGGAPRIGKSLIAKIIADSQHIELVATDDIYKKATRTLSPSERRTKFPLPEFSGTASENILTPGQRVELMIVSAKSLEQEIHWVISEAIAKGKSIVVEGVDLLPDFIQKLLTEYGPKNIHAIVMGCLDEDRVMDGLLKDRNPHSWLKEADAVVRRQVAEFAVSCSLRIKELAEQSEVTYVERTDDFDGDMKRYRELLIEGAGT